MKTVVMTREDAERGAVGHIAALLRAKPAAVLALAAGRSTRGLYRELSRLCAAGELSFRQAKIFAVAELLGVADGCSCRAELERELIANIDLAPESFFCPEADDCAAYDGLIEAAGGLDLAVLGIGDNGHIGYNEPATPFDSRTHVQKLTDATRRQLLKGGEDERAKAEYAVTMGVHTLVEARQQLLLAFGQEKAEPVFKMVYGKTVTYVPASFLQIPTEVSVYLDEAAAEKL